MIVFRRNAKSSNGSKSTLIPDSAPAICYNGAMRRHIERELARARVQDSATQRGHHATPLREVVEADAAPHESRR
jgi:hypothetical protein